MRITRGRMKCFCGFIFLPVMCIMVVGGCGLALLERKRNRVTIKNKVDEVEAVVVKLKEKKRGSTRKRKYECGDTSFKWGNMHHMMIHLTYLSFAKTRSL